MCTEHPMAPMSSPISLLLTQPLLMVMVWNTTVLPPVSLELSAVSLSEPSTLVRVGVISISSALNKFLCGKNSRLVYMPSLCIKYYRT